MLSGIFKTQTSMETKTYFSGLHFVTNALLLWRQYKCHPANLSQFIINH